MSNESSTIRINTKLLVDSVLEAAFGNGLPAETAADIARYRGKAPLIVVTAAPKSGSTYLANSLIHITGLRGFRLCSAYSTNEHDLYLPALCLMTANGCVTQVHMKGSYHNAELMRTFGIRPIVLVRRIEDIVVSLLHDLRQKAQNPKFWNGFDGYSFVWQDQCTKEMSDEKLVDLIIDLAVPWFVNFYVSWYRLCEHGKVDALWLTYEQLFADSEAAVRQVLEFVGVGNVGAIDPELLSRKYQTFRDGRIGQGDAGLNERQRQRLREQFAHYPSVDFSRYGI